jgi:hypothetical protein
MVIKKIGTPLRVETLSFRRSCGIHPAERKRVPQGIAQVEENSFNHDRKVLFSNVAEVSWSSRK